MRKVWLDAQAWHVGTYMIMPDHIHLFAAPGEPESEIESWMKYWKREVSIALGHARGTWQREQWHTRMRTGQQYSEKWDYVIENPVRHGLAKHASDWPYRGELFELEWLGA